MIRVPVRLAVCVGLAGMGWAGAILGDGSDQWAFMIFVLWGASAAVFAYPAMRHLRIVLPSGRRRAIQVKDIRQDAFTAFWLWVESRIPHIRRFREGYADMLRRRGGGLTYEYDLHARRAVHLAMSVAPLCVVPALYADMAALIAAAAPAIVLYPLMQVSERTKQHARQVEEEMSFFLCYLTVMQGVGYTLYAALDRMRGARDVFVAMSREASTVLQDVALGTPQMTALRKYAAQHTVPSFRDFLFGYISKHETVGPIPAYTEAKAGQFFESYHSTWTAYKDKAIMMVSSAVMASVMLPVMMVLLVFIATPATVNVMLAIGPALGPLMAAGLLFMAGSSQPSTGSKIKPWLPALGVGAAVAVAVHYVWLAAVDGAGIWDTEPGVTISLAFLAAALSNHIMTRRSRGGVSNVDRALPEFLGDVTEQVQAGTSITTILKQQARGGERGGLFGQLLRGIVSKLDTGATMEEACREARRHSRYLAFVLFVIVRLQELGSTENTPHVLRQMTKFMSGILATKLDVAKSLSMGSYMIYAAPIMPVGIMYGMLSMFGDASDMEALGPFLQMLPPEASFTPPDPDAGYERRLGVVAAMLTCPMGLVAAKIAKFTAVYTLPLAITSGVSAAALLLVPIVMDALPA